MNTQKKIAIINDISGFGRCSMTVALPIISAMKIQGCPVPTSIFSNHTMFPTYYFDDYTKRLSKYLEAWKPLNLSFDGIYCGFLGSEEQIEIISAFIAYYKKPWTKVIIDPVMADHGKIYATYTESMCLKMRELIAYADILTPNITEACLLTDTAYKSTPWQEAELLDMCRKLSKKGIDKIVITGIEHNKTISNFIFEAENFHSIYHAQKVNNPRPGTGDIFASIVAADAINGVSFSASAMKASEFIRTCMLTSNEQNIPTPEGVCFEQFLDRLIT